MADEYVPSLEYMFKTTYFLGFCAVILGQKGIFPRRKLINLRSEKKLGLYVRLNFALGLIEHTFAVIFLNQGIKNHKNKMRRMEISWTKLR